MSQRLKRRLPLEWFLLKLEEEANASSLLGGNVDAEWTVEDAALLEA
jgi:hypothetical protein